MKSKPSAHQILRVGINPSSVAVAGNILVRERVRVFLLLVRSKGHGWRQNARVHPPVTVQKNPLTQFYIFLGSNTLLNCLLWMCDVGLQGGRSFMDSYKPARMTSSIPVTKTSDPTLRKGSLNTAELSNLTRCPPEHSAPSPALAINIPAKDREANRGQGCQQSAPRGSCRLHDQYLGHRKISFLPVTAKVAERCRIACLPKALLSCSALTPPTPPALQHRRHSSFHQSQGAQRHFFPHN